MSVQDNDVLTPQQIINIRPATAAIKEFWFFPIVTVQDQHNPLSLSCLTDVVCLP